MKILFIHANGDAADTDSSAGRVGAKAAHLSRLARLGLRVPPAFVLGTDVCRETQRTGGRLHDSVRALVRDAIGRLEQISRRQFGGQRPLLVAVRSSPTVSMPGMLETVLNVGMTSDVVRGLLKTTGNPSFAWDTWRRFAEAFAEVVLECPAAPFARLRDQTLESAGVESLDEIDPLTMRDLAHATAHMVEGLSGSDLPSDPFAQLEATIEAVFRSWVSPRAIEYRRMSGVDDSIGTAVIVQAMVFGNSGPASGSGVGFTRNPSTGADEMYLDFLFNAQGEDVVSGREQVSEAVPLAAALPAVYKELLRAKTALEAEFHDMQDFEFTVQEGELYFLQSRPGKRTPWAALHIAIDLVRSGLIDCAEGVRRLAGYDLDKIQRQRVAPALGTQAVALAVPAGIGLASGAIAFDRARAQTLASTQPVILVRPDLTTDDVAGLAVAEGILTTRGGRTSHAAVVARHLGKVCLAGCLSLQIDEARRRCSFGNRVFNEGDVITLDGESGSVFSGVVPATIERPDAALEEVRRWRSNVEPGQPARPLTDGRSAFGSPSLDMTMH
jgi:pyruvate,orthophosphate dikinase